MLLRAYGHDAHAAYDPREVSAKVREVHPDVILMDVGLPGKDGFKRAAEIRMLSPNCKIVALTGFAHEQIIRRCREERFHGYLAKPAEPEALNRAISGLSDET